MESDIETNFVVLVLEVLGKLENCDGGVLGVVLKLILVSLWRLKVLNGVHKFHYEPAM